MDIKKTNASQTTKTYDRGEIENKTQNIYEAISIISKRAEQINGDVKKELIEKLEEFATYNDSLEEIFENNYNANNKLIYIFGKKYYVLQKIPKLFFEVISILTLSIFLF